MRRFTDSVLFLALFVLASLAWLILANTAGVPDAAPGRIAPMTVGAVVVIACPALLVATLLGLVRALTGTSPRRFYSWGAGTAVISSVVVALASVPAERQGVEVGFEWMAWYFGILALAFVIALVIALTGGIPAPKVKGAPQEHPESRPGTRPGTQSTPQPTPEPTPRTHFGSRKAAAPSSASTDAGTELGAATDPLQVTATDDPLVGRTTPGTTPTPDPAIHGTSSDSTTPREPQA